MTEAKESNGGALMQSPSPNHSEEIEYNPLYENLSDEIHKKRLEKKCRFGKKYSWEIAREILKKQEEIKSQNRLLELKSRLRKIILKRLQKYKW